MRTPSSVHSTVLIISWPNTPRRNFCARRFAKTNRKNKRNAPPDRLASYFAGARRRKDGRPSRRANERTSAARGSRAKQRGSRAERRDAEGRSRPARDPPVVGGGPL